MSNTDPLHDHYVATVRLVERLVQAHVPRLPFMPIAAALTDQEVALVAAQFAAAHRIPADHLGGLVREAAAMGLYESTATPKDTR